MKLTQIDILKYKSIKQPVSIVFNDGQVVTLIGKNGSGKTNVLEALNYIFEANAHSRLFPRLPDNLNYRVHIELNEEDVKSILPEIIFDRDKCELIAYNTGDGLKIDTIESDYLVPLLKQEISDIRDLAYQLESVLLEYEQIVESVAIDDDRGNISLMGFTLKNDHVTNFYKFKHIIGYNVQQAIKTVDKLICNLGEDNNALRYIVNEYISFYGIDDLKFELQYEEPILSEFEQKYISINRRAIKTAITKINKKTRIYSEKITDLSRELTKRTKDIIDAFDSDEIRQQTKVEQYYSFIKRVQMCVGRKCLFLRNDNSELLFGTQDLERRYQRNNNTDYIVETYLRQIYNGDNKDELLKAMNEGKGVDLPQANVDEFEEYLNSNIPKFDRGMFSGVKIENGKEKGLAIKLQEKDELIDLNSTSAGRRWYFTYYFMRNILQSGDVFIIDEPAGMLHPSAQQEVLGELQTLAAKGIKVVYSTHSSYLIPEDFSIVHNVEMGNNGTAIRKYDCSDDLCKGICAELGVQRASEILFALAKTTLIVEGESDKACLIKFFDVLKYDKSNYCIFECRGQPILDVAHLCIEWGVKFKALFDRDTIEKSREGYLLSHGYNTYLREIQQNPHCIFTPANGNRKSLEDCFSLNDQAKYFSKNRNGELKIDKNKIKKATEFDAETKTNFEQLFTMLGIPRLDETNS